MVEGQHQAEIEDYWALDKMHAASVTPLSFDLIVHTSGQGFTKAQAEYDCPIMVTTKEVNHYFTSPSIPSPTRPRSSDGWSTTTTSSPPRFR